MAERLYALAASDDRLLFAVAALIRSIRARLEPSCSLHMYLYLDRVSTRNRRLLGAFCRNQLEGVVLELIADGDFPAAQIADMDRLMAPRHRKWRVMMSRIFIPALFPSDAGRALYMDADAIANKDLSEANQVPLDGLPVGAVKAPLSRMQRRLSGVPRYFNSGVLLFDLHRWRSEDLERQCVEWLAADDPANPYADQDALNSVLCPSGAQRWKQLSPSWNAIDVGVSHSMEVEYEAPSLEEARILHFAGPDKPWEDRRHPLRALYLEHLDRAPFRVPLDLARPGSLPGRAAALGRRLRRAVGP